MSAKLAKQSDKQSRNQLRRQREEEYQAFQNTQEYRTRYYRIIRLLTLITELGVIVSAPIYISLGIVADANWFLMLLPLSLVVLVFGIVYFSISPTSGKSVQRAAIAIMAVSVFVVVAYCLILGAATALPVSLAAMLMSAMLGIKIRAIISINIIIGALNLVMFALESVFKVFLPLLSVSEKPVIQIIIYTVVLVFIIVEIVLLLQSLYDALGSSELRAQQSLEANQMLSRTTHFGSQVSVSLSSIVAELNATSRQQANGAQEQAAAVMEVTSSLTELGETARHIAANTNRVSVAANDGLYSAEKVREATQRASTTSDRGQVAVDSAIQAIEDVRNGITGLAERLMILTERSKQISSIIALIKEIADETHLLALNAAIESAGAGEHGRRFNVVASEVKSLADRSLEATSEVSHVIRELQGAVAAAVLASEETRKKTFGAVERSYQAGQVINELGQVVDETAVSSIQIVEAVQQVATLAEEISLATQQQESASRQIITTMEAVGLVAQETASAVAQVSETVGRIDNLSGQLKQVLVSPGLRPGLN